MALFDPSAVNSAPINTVVDEGWYDVQILKASAGASKQKGTPSLDLEYLIDSAPEQLDGRIVVGKHIFEHIYFSENHEISDRKVKKLTKAAGVAVESDEQVMSDLVGRGLKIKIKHREYQGEPQEEVADYKAL